LCNSSRKTKSSVKKLSQERLPAEKLDFLKKKRSEKKKPFKFLAIEIRSQAHRLIKLEKRE
jgi:hypothetical protein